MLESVLMCDDVFSNQLTSVFLICINVCRSFLLLIT